MYGVTGLNLDEIVGSELQQICGGRYDVQFHFHSGTAIMVQGDVTLHNSDEQLGNWNGQGNWSTLSFQRLLNTRVSSYSVPDDKLLRIEFENGLALQLHDSSDQYESFQITKEGNKEMIVV